MQRKMAQLMAVILCLALAACGKAPALEQGPQENHMETAGTEITTRQAIHMAKKGSNIVLVGYSKSGEMTLPMSLVLDKELTFKTVFRYRHIYPMAIDAVATGKVNLKGIVTDVFGLDEAQKAMNYSVNNKADIVKAVIRIAE